MRAASRRMIFAAMAKIFAPIGIAPEAVAEVMSFALSDRARTMSTSIVKI